MHDAMYYFGLSCSIFTRVQGLSMRPPNKMVAIPAAKGLLNLTRLRQRIVATRKNGQRNERRQWTSSLLFICATSTDDDGDDEL